MLILWLIRFVLSKTKNTTISCFSCPRLGKGKTSITVHFYAYNNLMFIPWHQRRVWQKKNETIYISKNESRGCRKTWSGYDSASTYTIHFLHLYDHFLLVNFSINDQIAEVNESKINMAKHSFYWSIFVCRYTRPQYFSIGSVYL